MLDFTSALYLGLTHPSRSLGWFGALTTGRPAALVEPPGATDAAARLAALVGCEAACLYPSTLHALWDLLGVAARRGAAILRDEGTYPIASWASDRAASLGARVAMFRHFDPDHLEIEVERARARGAWPLVVTDGYCIGCGRVAPLADLVAIARRASGAVIVDDAQMLGLAGTRSQGGGLAGAGTFGRGGGGSARFHGVEGAPELVLASTLAKAFGAPIAVVAASREWIDEVVRDGETRSHTSPPSVAAIRAASSALREDALRGEALRERLFAGVRLFRERARAAGAPLEGGLFPVQAVRSVTGRAATALHQRLLARGVRGVLTRAACAPETKLRFVLTARHEPSDLARAAQAIGEEVRALAPALRGSLDLGR